MRYHIAFTDSRIGRTHNVENMLINVKDGDSTPLETLQQSLPDSLATAVHSYARKFLMSREFDVDIEMAEDMLTGRGAIGWGRSGTFTVRQLSADESDPDDV